MNDSKTRSRAGNDAKSRRLRTNHVEQNEVEIRNNLVSSQWRFTLTAFPVLAGTFGPMASTFDICALTQSWMESALSDEMEDHKVNTSNPTWIIATNSCSLALGVTANLILISKFSRGPSFLVSHSIVVFGWYIASFILITTTAVASTYEKPFSEAFYYACFAGGLYFIVSSLMVVSIYAARSGHWSEESKRVRCETALGYQTISFNVYLLVGALIFAKIEKWNFLDAVYWADTTILTIGLGDFAPKSNLGRSLFFPYAIGGVLLLGLVVTSIQSFLTGRRKRKISMIMKEKQYNLLKRLQSSKLRSEINEEDFQMLRHIQHRVAQKQRWILLLGSGTVWFMLWLVSAAIFKRTERDQNWSYFHAIYFTFVSLMTIGYGDLYPTSSAGKALFVFWSLLAVPTITILVSSMGDTIIKKAKDYWRWLINLVQRTRESSRKKGLNCFLGISIGKKTVDAEHRVSSTQNFFSTGQGSSDLIRGKLRDESIRPLAGTEMRSTVYRSKDSMEMVSVPGRDLPYYHYQLIKEISKVTGHLLISPSREYTYNEWAWFHALISRSEHRGISRVDLANEDEWARSKDVSEPEIHTEGNGSSSSNGLELGGYLRSSISEPQWMLENLILTLKGELKSQVEDA